MKSLISFLALFLAACASNQPTTQKVEVPVAVSCVDKSKVPVRPLYESYLIDPQANDGKKIMAITRDWQRSRPYEAKLEAIAKECSK